MASNPRSAAFAMDDSRSFQNIHGPVLICGTRAMVTADRIIIKSNLKMGLLLSLLSVEVDHDFNDSLRIGSPILHGGWAFINADDLADHFIHGKFSVFQISDYLREIGFSYAISRTKYFYFLLDKEGSIKLYRSFGISNADNPA